MKVALEMVATGASRHGSWRQSIHRFALWWPTTSRHEQPSPASPIRLDWIGFDWMGKDEIYNLALSGRPWLFVCTRLVVVVVMVVLVSSQALLWDQHEHFSRGASSRAP